MGSARPHPDRTDAIPGHQAQAVSARVYLSCGVTQALLVAIGLLLIGLPLLALVADRVLPPPRARS